MIEYIDGGKRAIFNGLVFTRDEKTGYYLNSTFRVRLHRVVYEQCNGPIPDGHHVHHVDHDRGNNEPENLIALSPGDHQRLHGEEMSDEHREKLADNLRQNAIPAAVEWHKSEAGRVWHLKHYAETADAMHARQWMTCACCGAEFCGAANGTARFCSNACKSAWRRKAGIDNEIRKCEFCGGEFVANKYADTQTCSRSCANRLRAVLRAREGREAQIG